MPQHYNQPENKRVQGEAMVKQELWTSVVKRWQHYKEQKHAVDVTWLAVAIVKAITIAGAIARAIAGAIAVAVAVAVAVP